MHSRSDYLSGQSSNTQLFDDMMLSCCEDKADHINDDECFCEYPFSSEQTPQKTIEDDRPVQYYSSSSSSSSSSSIISTAGGDWDSFTEEKNDKEYDSATILDFPFDLLEDDYSTGDILFSLDDILWNDSTEIQESQLDCAFEHGSKQGHSSTVSPSVVKPLNMDKLDACMQRSAESRSMIKKLAAAMLPTPRSSFDTMSVISDDSMSACIPKGPQNAPLNHTTDLPPLSSPSLTKVVSSIECEIMPIQGKTKKANSKTKRAKKTTRTYKKRSPSEYICSGVLLKRVIPKITTQDESRDNCGNSFSTGSEATKTMIHKILGGY